MDEICDLLAANSLTLDVQAALFDEANRASRVSRRILPAAGTEFADAAITLPVEGAAWQVSIKLRAAGGIIDGAASFTLAAGEIACGNVALEFGLDRWSASNYVLMPAAAYNGNRYRVAAKAYPPFLHEEDGIGPDMPVTITNVPHLSLDRGPSAIHLRSGDLATPAVGVQMPATGTGILLLLEHITAYGYTGICLEESPDRTAAILRIEAPAVREKRYAENNSGAPSDDQGARFVAGDTIILRFRLLLFACPDVPALFSTFFEHRKDLCGSAALPHDLPLSAAYRIIERKFNRSQYNEQYQYYMLTPDGQGTEFGDWQAGWCGGGLSSLALYYNGGQLSRTRSDATMDSIFGLLQNRNGFILPVFSGGRALGDDFDNQTRTGVMLVRKNGDVLLYAARYILLAQKRGSHVPQRWLDGLRKLADAFVRLWEKHGQFGQFIDMDSEEILQGGTACGSIIPGGLALAGMLLGDGKYLRTAEQAAEWYYENQVLIGLLNGGPGEILQNPDSESASNMLESFVVLHDLTGAGKWLKMAEQTAHQCASWVVSYDFAFPARSSFGQLGMHTLGSVFANVQNKHSAPGYCTLSGAALLRLFRATGERRYLELARDTAHNITQYVSRADRAIPSWDDGKLLPEGWMCERVNMCDWEGKQKVGEVFYGSCWCEISCLLAYAEMPGVWIMSDSGEAVVIDHVDVAVTDAGDFWQLQLKNTTRFDSEIKVLGESRADFARPWSQLITDDCQIVPVPAGGQAIIQVRKAASPQPAQI